MFEIQIDATEVGRALLREQVLAKVRASGYAVETVSFWRPLGSDRIDAIPPGMLVVGDLSKVAAEFRRCGVHQWVRAFRRARPVVMAFVRTRRDERVTDVVDELVRHSDSRLWVCRASSREADLDRCLAAALDARDPEAIVEIRYLSGQDKLLVEYGDGLSGLVGWEQLGIADLAPGLIPESATVGSHGRSVELLVRAAEPGAGNLFEIDSASIRAALDTRFAEALRDRTARADASVGARLRDCRELANLTQVELSARTGIDQAVISRLERGKHRPRLDTLQRFADGLGLALSELLGSA